MTKRKARTSKARGADQAKPELKVRWLIRRDLTSVLKIEKASFEFAWCQEDFLACLRQRHCIGMVAELDGKVVGYMIYELYKQRLTILNFAVAPKHRRWGVGTAMVRRLKDKLSQQRRREIVLEVRETNLPAQLFFRSLGFTATDVLRGRYDDTGEDAYRMAFTMPLDDLLPTEDAR